MRPRPDHPAPPSPDDTDHEATGDEVDTRTIETPSHRDDLELELDDVRDFEVVTPDHRATYLPGELEPDPDFDDINESW